MKINFPFRDSPLHIACSIAAALLLSVLLIMLSWVISESGKEKIETPEITSSETASEPQTESEAAE